MSAPGTVDKVVAEPTKDVSYNLVLGRSLRNAARLGKSGESYELVRYSFRPSSIDRARPGQLRVLPKAKEASAAGETAVEMKFGSSRSDKHGDVSFSGTMRTGRAGAASPNKGKEAAIRRLPQHVLLFNGKQFRLEAIDSHFVFTYDHPKSSGAPKPGPAMSKKAKPTKVSERSVAKGGRGKRKSDSGGLPPGRRRRKRVEPSDSDDVASSPSPERGTSAHSESESEDSGDEYYNK